MTDSPRSPSRQSPQIRIRLLGPVSVEVDGRPLSVDTRKAVALLAYLAVTRRPASREAVAAMLWPEADDPGARGALRRTLSVLRAGLGDPGLIVDRRVIDLDPAAFEVDIWRFREALRVARGHEHPGRALCPTCHGSLQDAVARDRGEFMAGFALRDSEVFEEWHLAEAAACRRDLAAVLERLARGEAAAGAWDDAIAAARRWLALDPLHEPAHRLLMEALAQAGEPAAALAAYRDCVRILDRELGVAPLSETIDTAEEIRAGRPSGPQPALPAAADAGLRGATVRIAPAGLPLVGREVAAAALLAAYRAVGPDGRLLLVEGEAGIGKTRMAISLADAVLSGGGTVLAARAYPGEAGIPFAPIVEFVRAGLARPGAVARLRTVRAELLAETARLVALPGVPVGPPSGSEADPYGRVRLLDALAEVLVALAAGPTPGLIWLDDVGWADASTTELVAYVARRLRRRPVALLVTSRSEDVAGMREHVLGAAARDGLFVRVELGRLGRADVASLVEAALGGRPAPGLVDALLERSEGLPLHLVEALSVPVPSGDPIPEAVTALLRVRLDSVGEVAAQVLSAAAVIGRSFDLETVRASSGRTEDETIDGLDEAVRRGLVREVAPEVGGDVRYDFTHGLLRDVALDRLSLARRRLLHGHVADAISGPGRAGGSEVDRWSLIARHETSAGRSTRAAEAHRRAGHLSRSVFANREAREHLEEALALGSPAVAELHGALGEVLTLLGDYAAALGHLEAAMALADQSEQGIIEHRIGLVLARRGDWARAEARLVAAFDLIDAGTRPGLRSRIMADRAAIAHRAGDPVGATNDAEAALGLAYEAADPIAVARAEDLLGVLARSRGDLPAARDHLERALAAIDVDDLAADRTASTPRSPTADPAAGSLRDVSDLGVRIAALNTLALVLADAGESDRAIGLAREALVLCEIQGDRHRQAALENNLADLLHAAGRPDDALDHLTRAVSLFAEVGGRPGDLEPEIWKLVEW